jgi:3-hydroxyanthranilate 3,4-dioxygenase
MWFCEQCGNKLYEEFLHVSDIVEQLPRVFERFYGSLELRTCKQCGAVMEPPQPARE